MIFLVPGYGLPNDIKQDGVYPRYFGVVEAYIRQSGSLKPKLVFCGGNTDMVSPYVRTEAEEMKKLWVEMWGDNFDIFLENKSLSSLDNQLFAKQIIDDHAWKDKLVIFCERTRCERVKVITEIIYKKAIDIVPVDLYNSEQLKDLILMEAKERKEIEMVKWALSSSDNLEKFRKLFEYRLQILRETPEDLRAEKIMEMYRQFLETKIF